MTSDKFVCWSLDSRNLSPSSTKLLSGMRLVAVRVFGFDRDLARAGRRGELQLERTVGRGKGFAAGDADGVAGLRAPARDVDLPGQIFNRDVRDSDALARLLGGGDRKLLRLAPFARLT